MRGKFITLEGGEGMGKSSCLPTVLDELNSRGIESIATREPGGTALGEQLRAVLLDEKNKISGNAELLLMFAARAQHIVEVIEPALAGGRWVVSDRFTDASFAYQGGGRGIPAERIEALEQWLHADLQPDLTLLFDASVEVGQQRVCKRGRKDRFEREEADFFESVRRAYLQRAGRYPDRFGVLSSEEPLQALQQLTRRYVAEFIDVCVSA